MKNEVCKAIPAIGFLLLALTTLPTVAGDKHAHDHKTESIEQGPHVHGVAALNIALDGSELHVEMDSPAANIVGFEHTPKSDADHAALDEAVAMLKGGDQLFEFGSEVGCQLELAQVSSSLLNEAHKHDTDHADKHDHKGHGKDDHQHESQAHSDIRAIYHFECDEPASLEKLTVRLFEKLPRMEKLNVQYVVGNKQGSAQLTASNSVVEF